MNIKIINAVNYSMDKESKLRLALSHFENSVNSDFFRDSILNHAPFRTGHTLSNEEIYEIIMSGAESGTAADDTADLDLTLKLTNSEGIIGYTRGTSIFTYQNKFNENPPTVLAGHYAHEYCHTLGFADPARPSHIEVNVPYEVGKLITRISEGSHFRINLLEPEMNVNKAKAGRRMTNNIKAIRNKPAAKKAAKKKAAKKKVTKKKPAAKKTAKKK